MNAKQKRAILRRVIATFREIAPAEFADEIVRLGKENDRLERENTRLEDENEKLRAALL